MKKWYGELKVMSEIKIKVMSGESIVVEGK